MSTRIFKFCYLGYYVKIARCISLARCELTAAVSSLG